MARLTTIYKYMYIHIYIYTVYGRLEVFADFFGMLSATSCCNRNPTNGAGAVLACFRKVICIKFMTCILGVSSAWGLR